MDKKDHKKVTKKTLYYFTASFPFGLGETWKLNELNVLINEFDIVHVVPLYHHGNIDNPKAIPSKIIVHQPLMGVPIKKISLLSLLSIFDKNIFYYLNDFFSKKVYLKKSTILKWLETILRIKKLLKTELVNNLTTLNDPNTFFYFFWGIGSADTVPFLNKNLQKKIIVRMHRFDLFEDEVGNYIPFRKALIKYSSLIAPSSKAGEYHLRKLYPKYAKKINARMLGVKSEGRSHQKEDNIMRIVTASYIVPVKRLTILANALKSYTKPIEWTHLGDGPLKEELMDIIKLYPENIKVNMMGMVESTKVLSTLISSPFNLFINISESEGVPFSIMEALSAGIPVMATNVGGTGEIIDDSVGRILPKEITPEMLCKELMDYSSISFDEKIQKAENAFLRYINSCDSQTLTHQLAKDLKNL